MTQNFDSKQLLTAQCNGFERKNTKYQSELLNGIFTVSIKLFSPMNEQFSAQITEMI